MAKKKITRKELLKGPDEFLTLSSRAVGFLSRHTRELKYIGYAIGIAIIAYLAVNKYLGYMNQKGQNAYNKANQSIAESIQPDADSGNLQKSGELFSEVLDEYGFSKVASLALPQLAYVKFLQGNYDEAIELYREFLDEISGNAAYESLTRLALAACYEAKGDLKAAEQTLDPVLKRRNHPFRESAMYRLAGIYRLQNELDKEKEILETFVQEYPNSPFFPMAKARL